MHCPHCGRRLSVISESDRWTNGKPRFKYVCPGYRKKECNFKAVDGVLLDEFVVQQLSDLSDENSERFKDILEIKIEEVLEKSQTVQEHTFIKKKRDKLKADIAAQTRNLREADGNIKQFIQEDLQNLDEELRETERQLSKLDEGRKNNMIAIRDLEMTNRHFWARGYYVGTVRGNKKQIAEYIRNQLASDQIADQIGLKKFVDLFTGRENKKA